ncbi:hypothetical protein ACFYON_11445 [Micromonospora sp. NPDC005686]|uniref:hypothetical protein n=1 Tax=unclassified Micromonospora TaxID=2617518 RepID=UPI0033A694B5
MRAAPAIAAVAALLVPIAGCARTDAPPVITDGPSPLAAEVVLVKSGGIAGVKDTVTVRPDGQWTKTDRTGAAQEGRLATADLTRLQQLTTDPRLAAETAETKGPDNCADGFTYRLTVGPAQTGYVDCGAAARPPAVTAQVVELLGDATG